MPGCNSEITAKGRSLSILTRGIIGSCFAFRASVAKCNVKLIFPLWSDISYKQVRPYYNATEVSYKITISCKS